MGIKISYAITVCNEHDELDNLLGQLQKVYGPTDQIVIQMDAGKVTAEVESVIEKYGSRFRCEYIYYKHAFSGDFAEFKNELASHCNKDYIFQIDADELLGRNLLEFTRAVIEANSSIDMFVAPRLNLLRHYTDLNELKAYAESQNWILRETSFSLERELETLSINFPDYQTRIYRNVPEIRWKNKVHEKLDGVREYTFLPDVEDWCLIHVKSMEKQKKQNLFYESLISN